ncbi:MAG: C40 family peptidase, partial [Clostridia bacterium]|nr:C40 family peptidase [Clostridia bacterium]
FLGTPYVYGAVRLHDGKGNMLKGFTKNAFDCSSLMQYMFYEGAGKLLNVTTRTQVSQGKTVSKSQLKRGDLMFFTNASRKNNTGVERIGHVAIYLGDNYILHTASDYAKIEQISATRWGYFIQAQRML